MERADRLVQLGGFTVLAVVLGTASWTGVIGVLAAFLITLAAVGYAGYVGFDWLRGRLRREAEDAAARDDDRHAEWRTPAPVSADGGRRRDDAERGESRE